MLIRLNERYFVNPDHIQTIFHIEGYDPADKKDWFIEVGDASLNVTQKELDVLLKEIDWC